jgi:hypothetical protein
MAWHLVDTKNLSMLRQAGGHEIARNFRHERHHGCDELILVLIDRTKIPCTLHDDDDYDSGLWTGERIPPSAIIEVVEVDEDYFDIRQFRRYMGVEQCSRLRTRLDPPSDEQCEGDGGTKVPGQLVVSCSDPAPILQM